jgi:rhodopsin domain-containing protein
MPATIIAVHIVTWIVVGLRTWVRFRLIRNSGLDDWVMLASMIPLIGLAITIPCAMRIWGYDRHIWDMTPALAVTSRKVAIAIEVLYTVTAGLIKISILLFYRRLAEGSISKTFQWTIKACILFVTLATIIIAFCSIFVCRPVSAYWNMMDFTWALSHVRGRDYYCFNEGLQLLIENAIFIVQDIVTYVLPITLFWKLQMPFRQKLALAVLFGLGFLGCICAIIRFEFLFRTFYRTYDAPWAVAWAWFWTGFEVHVAAICASAPALKVFFKRYLNIASVTEMSNTTATHKRTITGNSGTVVNEKETSARHIPLAPGIQKSKVTQVSGGGSDLELGQIEVHHDYKVTNSKASEDWPFDSPKQPLS